MGLLSTTVGDEVGIGGGVCFFFFFGLRKEPRSIPRENRRAGGPSQAFAARDDDDDVDERRGGGKGDRNEIDAAAFYTRCGPDERDRARFDLGVSADRGIEERGMEGASTSSYTTAVTSGELSVLVAGYLSSEGFSRTLDCFREEARGLLSQGEPRRELRTRPGPDGEVKPLRGILSEYVGLVEEGRRRRGLGDSHPLARKIVEVLEEYASGQDRRPAPGEPTAYNFSPSPCPSGRAVQVYGQHHQQGLGRRPGSAQRGNLFGPGPAPTPSPLRRRKGSPRKRGASRPQNGGFAQAASPRRELELSSPPRRPPDIANDQLLPYAEDIAQRINSNAGGDWGGVSEDYLAKLEVRERERERERGSRIVPQPFPVARKNH